MKFDPASRLREYIAALKTRGYCSATEMIDIMRKTRLLLEKGETAKTYPTLTMYCHWTMHGEMDRNDGGHALLCEIDRVLVDHWTANTSTLIREISNVLSLATLRKELIKIFEANSIDTVFFDVFKNWLEFVGALLADLLERPITFAPDVETNKSIRGRKIFLQMLGYRNSKGMSSDLAARSVWFTSKQENDLDQPAGFYWNVKIKEQSPEHFAVISGYLAFTERLEDFKH